MNLYTWTVATMLDGDVALIAVAEDVDAARANIMTELNENYEDLDIIRDEIESAPESVTNVTEHPVIVAF